uniref:Alternative protein CELSR3 n=1 Tax=Homo sapiens TaxID=9606 RepID=L0R6E8_HUMAN|nr:alternative protein CELSR3 [Homo sapiens]
MCVGSMPMWQPPWGWQSSSSCWGFTGPTISWCALQSPSSCTTSSSAPSRGSSCRGCTSTACRLSHATWTAAPCASTMPWAGASLLCCWALLWAWTLRAMGTLTSAGSQSTSPSSGALLALLSWS